MLFLFGNFKEWLLNEINTYILPPAFDIDRFSVATENEKIQLRRKYKIPLNKRVVLHVGHVRPTRNVSTFINVQRLKDVQVLIVDSTSTPQYGGLNEKLRKEGIVIFHRYIPDISEIYKLSDIYVFPVKDEIASINLPLSILEAMACGLPIITTRFGGIEGYFKDDNGFRYFNTEDELIKLISQLEMNGKSNREKVKEFTWERLVNDMIECIFRE
jgi:glycosyltransferase involved in cell wall biosynthesis